MQVIQDGSFHTKVVGVTFQNDDGSDRQRIIRNLVRSGDLEIGTELYLVPQPTNRYDPNCIQVNAANGQTLGNLAREVAAKVAPRIKQGYIYKAFVSSQTGGDIGYSYGINLRIDCYKPEPERKQTYGQVEQRHHPVGVTKKPVVIHDKNTVISSNPQVQQLFLQALDGDMVAQHNMGGCYMEGVGVEKNPTEAAYWFRKAAEQGSTSAQDNLGLFYMNGIGVEKDESEALTWFVLAANSGSADAQNNLGCCYMEGVGVRIDPQSAIKWWKRAADQDHPAALFNLGLVYLDGSGVERDTHLGLQYIIKSSQQGHPPAIDFLNSLK